MEYIVLREIEIKGKKSMKVGKRISSIMAKRLPDQYLCNLLPIDGAMFVNAFNSFCFVNWLRERAFKWDEHGNAVAIGLSRSPEMTILYLRELGITTQEIIDAMTGYDSSYSIFLKLASEFSQIIIQ